MENSIQFKEIVGFLPFDLKCQYEGIINGEEIAKDKKEFEKENEPYCNWREYDEIKPIYGLKIGILKQCHNLRKYWKCCIGIKSTKNFYNGNGFKPIVRPMSDLTKEIEHKGKLINPMVEICKMITPYYHKIIPVFDFNIINSVLNSEERVYQIRYKVEDEDSIQLLNFYRKNGSLWHSDNTITQEANSLLYELHFDVYDWIKDGKAIDINTL